MLSDNIETPYDEEDEYIECVVRSATIINTNLLKLANGSKQHG